MKRRWFGVVLVAWSCVAALFACAPALANGEKYTFQDANTIIGSGGSGFGSPQTFKLNNGVYASSTGIYSNGSLRITGVTKSGTDFSGTLEDRSGAFGGPATGKIAITDPNNVGPGAGGNGGGSGGGGSGSAGTTDQAATCDAGPVIGWLICGVIKWVVGVIDWIRDNIIVPFLQEKPLNKDTDAKEAYQIWSSFRNVASVFFILIFFLVIFGTALGWDNYTIKKILPRLVAGAVLVPFSWYLCVVMIDLGNILGQGLLALTSQIIPNADISFRSNISKLFLGGTIALGVLGAASAVSGVGLGVLISMLIAFLSVFFTLVLRKILILLLVVISPFAFLAWVLPNTTKWFKEWWTNLFKLIMMYPIVIMLFEAGRLFAATTGATAGNAIEKGVSPLFQLVGLTLPLFAVPFAFSWAGKGLSVGRNAIGKAAGSLDKRVGKNSDWAKERNERKKERSAAAATGRPVSFLGRRLQQDRHGNARTGFIGKRVAGVARYAAARRGGFGAFSTSAANARKIETAADKHFNDEAAASAIRQTREAEMASNQFKGADAYLAQRTSAQVADIRNKNKAAAASILRNARDGSGLTLDEYHRLATGETIDGASVGLHGQTLGGQIMQEAAIEQLSKQGEYEKLRANWADGKIDSTRLRAGMAGDASAASKARDLVLGTETVVRQSTMSDAQLAAAGETRYNPGSDYSRRQDLKGRSVDQFAGFDKSTRWEYIDKLATLKERYEATPVGSPERAKAVEEYNTHQQEVFRNLAGSLESGGSSLDPKTLQAIYDYKTAAEVYPAGHPLAGQRKELGFTPEQQATLAGYLDVLPDGSVRVKRPKQQVEVTNLPGGGTP